MKNTEIHKDFYLTPFNFIGLNVVETMSMDMYKEIAGGTLGAAVSLPGLWINRKGMLKNSKYNSDLR